MAQNKSRARQATIAAVIVAPLTMGAEGLRHYVYLDPVGVKTYCIGDTKNPVNRFYSTDECKALLQGRLVEFYDGVAACIHREMPDTVAAAFTDFAYNLGVGGFCRSSVARLYNAGDREGACDAILLYDKAKGRIFPGILKRRQQERDLCRS